MRFASLATYRSPQCTPLSACREARRYVAPQAPRRLPPQTPKPGSRVTPSTPPPTFLSPYGAALHGQDRGPRAMFAEPMNSWLALLGDAVPFLKDCLVVCPSSMSEQQVRAVWNRAGEHLPTAHVAVMKKSPTPVPLAVSQPYAEDRPSVAEAASSATTPASSSTSLSSTSAGAVVANDTNAVASVATPYSPLASLPPGSLDVIVFVGNVFADEMLFDAPWHISLAHRALRPHGVLGIFGYDREVAVTAPAWAAEDTTDFFAAFHEEVDEALADLNRLCQQHGIHDGPLSASMSAEPRDPFLPSESSRVAVRRTALRNALMQAREAHVSESLAHVDTYFPFLAVQRRWFVSEYAMQPADVAACVRAQRSFGLLRQWERERDTLSAHAPRDHAPHTGRHVGRENNPLGEHSSNGESESGHHALIPPESFSAENAVEGTPSLTATEEGEKATESAASDFVDTDTVSVGELGERAEGRQRHAYVALNVHRRTHAADPLEALEALWDARLALDGQGRPRARQQSRSSTPSLPLRAQVRHFVVTCSNRSMNTVGSGLPPSSASLGASAFLPPTKERGVMGTTGDSSALGAAVPSVPSASRRRVK